MKTAIGLTSIALVFLVAFVALTACDSPELWRPDPETQRLAAAADLANAEAAIVKEQGKADVAEEREEANSDVKRLEARALAEASFALIRQSERDAAHIRWIETLGVLEVLVLPIVVAMGTIAAMLTLAFMRLQPTRQDPMMERLFTQNRELWHKVAHMSRRVSVRPITLEEAHNWGPSAGGSPLGENDDDPNENPSGGL